MHEHKVALSLARVKVPLFPQFRHVNEDTDPMTTAVELQLLTQEMPFQTVKGLQMQAVPVEAPVALTTFAQTKQDPPITMVRAGLQAHCPELIR
jgi:hypothetical protein